MNLVSLTINDLKIEAEAGIPIVEAATAAGVYIPTICYHPDLVPGKTALPTSSIFQGPVKHDHHGGAEGGGCGLCVVEVEGETEPVPACAAPVAEGMVIKTESDRLKALRREKLMAILADHPHACLTCAQNEGCTRTQCSTNVPENERCCPQLGACQLQAVSEYIGIPANTPRWRPTDLPILDGPLFTRDYNLCIGCTRCVRACEQLRGIMAIGFVRDESGKNIIGSIAETLEESGCRFCTACVQVCPTGALMDKGVRTGYREEDLVPCRAACPAGVDIPWYIRLISEGRFDEAHSVIREKVPFPGILGRICVRPCEDACRRAELNEPVSICALKRAAADHEKGGWKNNSGQKAETGKKAAVIGAGPAGLACAFYLRKAGHSVTVFEAEHHPGGMLRYGIPEYRLPEALLDQEINDVLDTGISLKTGMKYGVDFKLKDLDEKGFQAVFLAPGAQTARRIPVRGSDKNGVMWGMDFLRDVRRGEQFDMAGNVTVIGGGNVAIDVAMTARRLGGERVDLVCLESREEMPAHEWECLGAITEGVVFHNSWGPRAILGNDKVTGVEFVSCTSVFDDKGRFNPSFDESQRVTIKSDLVILAVGQAVESEVLEADRGLEISGGLIVVDGDQSASLPGTWAGGDATDMPGSVVSAIAAGRKGAAAIDRHFGGPGDIEEVLFERPPINQEIGRIENFAKLGRETVPCILPETRNGFEEIEEGYDEKQARLEASRCLQCDLRLYMGSPAGPPEKWHAFTMEAVAEVPETEGVYQLVDADKNVLAIKGAMNLKQALQETLDSNQDAAFFEWEEDKMYTKRESEMLQQYLQQYGEMPGGGDDELDDLF